MTAGDRVDGPELLEARDGSYAAAIGPLRRSRPRRRSPRVHWHHADAGGFWGLGIHEYPGAALHAVAAGAAWLDLPDQPPTRLCAGDVVPVPPATPHGLTSQPGITMRPCDAASAAHARSTGAVMRLGTEPRHTRLVTLLYERDPAVTRPVLAALDESMHVRAHDNPSLQGIVAFAPGRPITRTCTPRHG